MATAKKEVTYRVLDKKNFVGFMHPKTKKFITANENNEFVVSEDDKEAIEILERAAEIVEKIQLMLPNASEDRILSVLNLVIFEINSYNTCKIDIAWDEFEQLIIEVIYKALKNEIDKSVASVKRGDTSISYVVESKDIQSLMKNYSSAIKRILGCDSGVFFY